MKRQITLSRRLATGLLLCVIWCLMLSGLALVMTHSAHTHGGSVSVQVDRLHPIYEVMLDYIFEVAMIVISILTLIYFTKAMMRGR